MATPPIVQNGAPTGIPKSCIPLSSKCVIWQGPDIACIDLYTGDSIDEVVSKLATLLCDISDNQVDPTAIDWQCIADETRATPTNLQETIQFIIDGFCKLNGYTPSTLARSMSTFSSTSDGTVNLPSELFSKDSNGDQVTQMSNTDFLDFTAKTLVTLIKGIKNNDSALVTLYQSFSDLQHSISTINKTATAPLTVQTQCASSNGSPGAILPIERAFVNFENTFCTLVGMIGTNTNVLKAINKQPGNLPNLNQAMYPELYMKNISGWIDNPATLSESITNLWLTVGDLRNGHLSYTKLNPKDICVLAPPENVSIKISDSGANVEWSRSTLKNIEKAIGFMLNVYEVRDENNSKPLYSKTVNVSSHKTNYNENILSESILTNQDYKFTIKALYKCGTSKSITLVQNMRTDKVLLYANVVIESSSIVKTFSCTNANTNVSSNYTPVIKQGRIDFYEKITSTPTGNPLGDTDVTLKFAITYSDLDGPMYEYKKITVPRNATSASFTFVSQKKVNALDGSCVIWNKSFVCGQQISDGHVQFDPKVTICV